MLRRLAFLMGAIALVLAPIAIGCGSDDDGDTSPGPTTADFSGNWDISGQVVARTTCSNDIGTIRSWDGVITQVGDAATLTLDGGDPVQLTVNGNEATGSTLEDGATLDFDLTISGNEFTGTITVHGTNPACTEQWDISGLRTNSTPSSGFAGSWDLQLEILVSQCDAGKVGQTLDVCVTIGIDGNTLYIQDENGQIAGVGDGNTALLTRTTEEASVEVELTLDGDNLSGTVTTYDYIQQCQESGSLTGSRRSSACPVVTDPNDFAGYWNMNITVSASQCVDEVVGTSFPACMSVVVNGNDISLDDNSVEGPITGTIDGNQATMSRTSAQGTLTVEVVLDGDTLYGSATMAYSSGDCAGSNVSYTVEGTRRDSECGSGSGGPWEGFWNITGDFTLNECGFTLQPTCSEFLQDGNTVYIVEDGITTTAEGNHIAFTQVEEADGIRFTYDVDLTLANDHDSFTGTQSITLENIATQQSCTSTASVVGVRTSGCTPTRPAFLIAPPGE